MSDADLILDINSAPKVAPGSKGIFSVTVETNAEDVSVMAWDTELVVDSNAELITLEKVEATSDAPLTSVLSDFQATVDADGLQAGSFAPASASMTLGTLRSIEGPVSLYRVHYTISPSAIEGDVIAVNFSANGFTNFLDESVTAIPLVRSGATLSVSAVPEPTAWAYVGVVLALYTGAAKLHKARTQNPPSVST